MFVQTEINLTKFFKISSRKTVSNSGPYEITNKDDIQNELVKIYFQWCLRSFLGKDLLVNKNDAIKWEDIKHIVISLINDFYSDGREFE